MDDRIGRPASDTVTGFNGVITARCEYMTGSVWLEIQTNHAGKVVSEWFDEARVSVNEHAARVHVIHTRWAEGGQNHRMT